MFGELVKGRETKITPKIWLSKCFNSRFTCEDQEVAGASPWAKLVPDKEALFLVAMTQNAERQEIKILNKKIQRK